MPFTYGHALIIGVGDYKYVPQMNVPVVVRDADAVDAVLRDAHFCGYPDSQVIRLTDAQANAKGILDALDDLTKRVKPEDTVFLFYVGHGADGADGNYYLVSHDAQMSGSKVVPGTGVSQQDLIEKLRNIHAKRIILVFNTCHSGEISPTLGTEPILELSNVPETTAYALLGTGTGRIIITACREDQNSYIGKGTLTYFTQALVDGLRGKGLVPRGGTISAFDLYSYVYETVRERVEQDLHTVQEPELTILKGIGSFALSLYRGAMPTGLGLADHAAELPPDTAVREVKPEKVARVMHMLNSVQTTNQSGGVVVEGDNTGEIITGNQNTVQRGKYNIKIDQAKGIAIGDGAQAHSQDDDDTA